MLSSTLIATTLLLQSTLDHLSAALSDVICQDTLDYSDCYHHKNSGYCETYRKDLWKLCPVTCGFCKRNSIKVNNKCRDSDGILTCLHFKRHGVCHTHKHLMEKRCQSTCKLCDERKKCTQNFCPRNKRCELNENGMPVCRCNNYCPNKKHYRRLGAVCASDGNNYKDFCHMLHHSCRLDRELWVIYYGDCKKGKTCKDNEREKKSGSCSTWQKNGYCTDLLYKDIMVRYCPETCGLCPKERIPKNCATSPENCCWDWKREEGQTTHLCPNMECKDKFSRLCRSFISLCNTVDRGSKKFMRESCSNTCGFCNPKEGRNPRFRVYSIFGRRLSSSHLN